MGIPEPAGPGPRRPPPPRRRLERDARRHGVPGLNPGGVAARSLQPGVARRGPWPGAGAAGGSGGLRVVTLVTRRPKLEYVSMAIVNVTFLSVCLLCIGSAVAFVSIPAKVNENQTFDIQNTANFAR